MTETLALEPTLPPLRWAEVLGERVAYRVLSGPLRPGLVALHGLGSDSRDLVELARALHMGALLIDLPGFGASARPERAYPVARAAEVVLTLLDQLGWRRPVWMGASYGAHVALRAALDAPARVERLVLLAAGGLDPAPPPGLAAYFAEERLAARTRDEVAVNLAALVGRETEATRAFCARRLGLVGAPVLPGRNDLSAVARSALGALACDAPRQLERVGVPVDLFHGERDPLVPAAVARAAAERLPRGRLHLCSGLGHLPWLEDPAGVAARVRRALGGCPGEGASARACAS
ncbi:MAG: alpha/beta fold hydrolase [Planctomycetota bacterium]